MVHACCLAHSRRKVVEALKLNPKDLASTRIVKLMDDLFAIDAKARTENLDDTARHQMRLEKHCIAGDIRTEVLAIQKRRFAQERCGQGRQLHAGAVEQTTGFSNI